MFLKIRTKHAKICNLYVKFIQKWKKGFIACELNKKERIIGCKIGIKRGSNARHLIYQHMGMPPWIQLDFNFSNEAIFTFSAYLTTWPQMTFDLGILPRTLWTYEGSINQVWFQSDFNFSNEVNFAFLAHLTMWPLMTFDHGLWYLAAWTYEGSHIILINQVWFQLDFQLFKWGLFHIFSLSYNLTSDELWPWNVAFDLINKWDFPCCIYYPTLVEIYQCGRNNQMFTCFHNNRHKR